MITTVQSSSAAPATLHDLLVDVDAWRVWSPHVASVESATRRVEPGWVGATRAFFSPVATSMIVDEVRADGGYSWHSELGPWRLDYDNVVEPHGDGSTLRFTASVSGPAGAMIERCVAPLSRRGQRRRMARLARLGELVDQQAT